MSRLLALGLVAGATLSLLGCASSSQPKTQNQAYRRPAAATTDAAAMDQALDELLDEMSPEQLAALLAPPSTARQPSADVQAQAIVESLTPEQRAQLLQQLLSER